jgi:hypothetical protein
VSKANPTALDRSLAKVCELCPVCRQASHSQAGLAFTFVKNIETSLCPFCMAYERVHGKKAHEKRDIPSQ